MLAIIKCVVKACEQLKIPYRFFDENQNFLGIELPAPYYFVNFATPFGRQDLARIYKDKVYTFQLLHTVIRTPFTRGFLDPLCRESYRHYVQVPTYEKIVAAILEQFTRPVIVKRNQGTRGTNVFLCHDEAEIAKALTAIFNKNRKEYDYIAVAQEYIPIYQEFRVILFSGEILLVYQKDIQHANFVGNLSPLHWENARAVLVTDNERIGQIKAFLTPLQTIISGQFLGLDLILATDNNWWLLEINSQPDFEIFIRDNGDARVVDIFKTMLLTLKNDQNKNQLS